MKISKETRIPALILIRVFAFVLIVRLTLYHGGGFYMIPFYLAFNFLVFVFTIGVLLQFLDKRAIVYIIPAAALIGFGHYCGEKANNWKSTRTKDNAERIIKSLDKYYSDHKSYPLTLEELKPDYMKRIPLISFGFIYHEPFIYKSDGKNYSIAYYTTGNFVEEYRSEDKYWGGYDTFF